MSERGHRFIVTVAVLIWIAIATGAFQSSSRIALNVAQLGTAHLVPGVGALFAVFGLCFWGSLPRTALGLGFASVALSSITGWISPVSPGRVVWHAVFSHLAIGL